MRIDYLGHACFKVSGEGYSVVFDPYEDGAVPGLSDIREEATVVLCSHGHHDHCAIENVKIVPGSVNISVAKIPTFHDHHQGGHRGNNLIHIIEAEGLKIAHFGDLGHIPTDEQYAQLKDIDVAMVPVGGHFTIDADEAAEIVKNINPRVTIPMHYRTEKAGYDVIGTVDGFLKHFGSENVQFCKEYVDSPDKNGIYVLDMVK